MAYITHGLEVLYIYNTKQGNKTTIIVKPCDSLYVSMAVLKIFHFLTINYMNKFILYHI